MGLLTRARFALAPAGRYDHRRVLLESLATFALLLGLLARLLRVRRACQPCQIHCFLT